MGRHEENIISRRSKSIKVLMSLIFLLIIIRLYFIQILKGEEYQNQVNRQHIFNIESSMPRGNIFDRNGVKITNQYIQKTAFISKRNIDKDLEKQNKLKEALNCDNRELKRLLSGSNPMIEIPLSKSINIDKLNSIGEVIIIDKFKRYNKNNLLSHTLGYVNEKDNVGLSGIEKSYDQEPLKADLSFGKTPLFVDAKRNIVPGISVDSVRNNNNVSNSLQLTVDYILQEKVEKILDKSKKKGAVIVSEVSSGDILSIASRPNIDLNNVQDELDKGDRRFFNKALELSYPAGSIFKIPVLLAGLEDGIISMDDEMYCTGYDQVGNTIINCNKKEGHGKLTIEEGLYKSCNSIFIQIGKQVGANNVIKMAKLLGFGEKIEVGIQEESKGNLPSGRKLLGPAIGNISIGQGEIEVTPMQVTNMMMILANRGIKKDMSLVKNYTTEEGLFAKSINRNKEERVISEKLAEQVKVGLDSVIDKGTARNIK